MMAPMLCKFEIFASSGIEEPTCLTTSSNFKRLNDSTLSYKRKGKSKSIRRIENIEALEKFVGAKQEGASRD